ncbi:oxysterol-binding protein-related protein 11 isoform X1 [Halyomorpha halys]|uniref:oxysterol-binding protein-related protein 11 isoform X1 n=2 Tax=Halyomorpha halys TaxID=286706 RepID=UPI0006D51485|nr:oxysterol-binding protein-related protein 11-like isoform X1 [Halyomorpha halys]
MKNMMKRKKKKSKKKNSSTDFFNHTNCEELLSNQALVRNLSYESSDMSAEMMCQLYEGQLSKYTNVMKGWQFRWFILDPKTGILSYFLNENERKQNPRGWTHLESAVISPSDEDSNTFTVNSTSGESFKLRAQDAKARQEWVNRLRAVSQLHASATAQNNPPLPPREHHAVSPKQSSGTGTTSPSLALWEAFTAVREHLFRAEQHHLLLSRTIDELPSNGKLKHVDPDLLMLKASSHAMLVSLNQCLFILQQQTQDVMSSKVKGSSKHDHSIPHSKKKFPI